MADIDIFNIQPHQVSRDLRGYSVFFYGGWKTFCQVSLQVTIKQTLN